MMYDFCIPFYHLDRFKSAVLYVAGRVFIARHYIHC